MPDVKEIPVTRGIEGLLELFCRISQNAASHAATGLNFAPKDYVDVSCGTPFGRDEEPIVKSGCSPGAGPGAI